MTDLDDAVQRLRDRVPTRRAEGAFVSPVDLRLVLDHLDRLTAERDRNAEALMAVSVSGPYESGLIDGERGAAGALGGIVGNYDDPYGAVRDLRAERDALVACVEAAAELPLLRMSCRCPDLGDGDAHLRDCFGALPDPRIDRWEQARARLEEVRRGA